MPMVNRELLVEIAGGEEAVRELLQLFFGSAHDLMRRLRQALADEDRDTIQKAAHQLAGAAGTCGFDPLEECARGIETRPTEMAWTEVTAGVETAAALLEETETEADALFPGKGGNAP